MTAPRGPLANLPTNVPGGVYWFNPAAFAPPADGALGATGRSIFRLPGVKQWDLTLSKNWYPSKGTRLQFRADFINAFNKTQFDPASIQATCTVANGHGLFRLHRELRQAHGHARAARDPARREVLLELVPHSPARRR